MDVNLVVCKWNINKYFLQAGIKKDDLTLALEPEAASVYCQYLNSVKEDTLSPSLGVVKPGTKYMVIDLGGKIFLA